MQLNINELNFPLLSPPDLPSGSDVAIWDYEALGVHGPRKIQILKLAERFKVYLLLSNPTLSQFEAQLYQAALDQIKSEIPNLQVVLKLSNMSLVERVYSKFPQVFPVSSTILGFSAKKLVKDYIDEVSIATWLTEEWLRYFPLFLKERFPERVELFEVAQYEVFRSILRYQDFSSQVSASAGLCYLNPSLQVAKLSSDAKELSHPRGLYALYRVKAESEVIEVPLEAAQARLIDHLSELMAMPKEDLIALTQGEFATQDERVDFAKVFQEMVNAEMIFFTHPIS